MGIRFNYPANWNFSVYYGFEEVFCKGVSVNCELVINPNYELSSCPNIVAFVISAARGPTFERVCNSAPPIDFVRWHYNHIQNASMFIFDNDSKTVIARNTPAWQIEYDTGFAGESTHNLDIVTISNGNGLHN